MVLTLRRLWPVETSSALSLVLLTVAMMPITTAPMSAMWNACGLRRGLQEKRLPRLPPASTSLIIESESSPDLISETPRDEPVKNEGVGRVQKREEAHSEENLVDDEEVQIGARGRGVRHNCP